MSELGANLTKPFPSSAIRHRQGGGGKQLAYIAGGDVIRRVLDCAGLDYSWTVKRLETCTDKQGGLHWLCIGTLTIGESSWDGVGTNPILDGESAKGAETDAYKRAARLAGVGLELYQDEPTMPVEGAESHGDAPKPGLRVWTGPGQCPSCHSPEGKPHGSRCEQS